MVPIPGLSPHIRGNGQIDPHARPISRSIPAHTGERRFAGPRVFQYRVYPRTYGGTRQRRLNGLSSPGLSPHIRGNAPGLVQRGGSRGSIPAHTGERRGVATAETRRWVYPRTYGGTKPNNLENRHDQGLSPHIRGNVYAVNLTPELIGSIPAHTGERYLKRSQSGVKWVYPRTYGGTVATIRFSSNQ